MDGVLVAWSNKSDEVLDEALDEESVVWSHSLAREWEDMCISSAKVLEDICISSAKVSVPPFL